jgi:hypothetical protein
MPNTDSSKLPVKQPTQQLLTQQLTVKLLQLAVTAYIYMSSVSTIHTVFSTRNTHMYNKLNTTAAAVEHMHSRDTGQVNSIALCHTCTFASGINNKLHGVLMQHTTNLIHMWCSYNVDLQLVSLPLLLLLLLLLLLVMCCYCLVAARLEWLAV